MANDNPIAAESELHLVTTGEPPRGMFRWFPPATSAELWAGLFLMAVSLLGAAWVIKCRAEALALEQDCVNVQGKVVRLWKSPNRGGWYYRVEYEYAAPAEVDAQTFRNTTELPK